MRRHLIIGASGTFGRAFLRHLASQEPEAEVVCVGRDPILLEGLRPLHPRVVLRVGDILDPSFLASLGRPRPHVILHAAALKVVSLGESDPVSYLRTNVLGTLAVARAFHGHSSLLLLSTDKAVEPVNFYGLTKAMAERLWPGTILRLGNVIDARGGVLRRWLSGHGPITVYQPTPTRFVFFSWQVAAWAWQLLERGPGLYIPRELVSVDLMELARAIGRPIQERPLPCYEKAHEVLASLRESRMPAGPFWRLVPGWSEPITSDRCPRIRAEEVIHAVRAHCGDWDELSPAEAIAGHS